MPGTQTGRPKVTPHGWYWFVMAVASTMAVPVVSVSKVMRLKVLVGG